LRQAIQTNFFWAIACAQSNLTFEVASVKASSPVQPGARVYFGPPRGGPGTSDPGQITWTYATLTAVLTSAYDVGTAHAIAKAQTVAPLTARLGNQLVRPVLNKTGLTGMYEIGPADNATDASPDLTTAVQQQLGLKLLADKANLDVLMIDKIEKTPMAN
jgi:hypothetical protein